MVIIDWLLEQRNNCPNPTQILFSIAFSTSCFWNGGLKCLHIWTWFVNSNCVRICINLTFVKFGPQPLREIFSTGTTNQPTKWQSTQPIDDCCVTHHLIMLFDCHRRNLLAMPKSWKYQNALHQHLDFLFEGKISVLLQLHTFATLIYYDVKVWIVLTFQVWTATGCGYGYDFQSAQTEGNPFSLYLIVVSFAIHVLLLFFLFRVFVRAQLTVYRNLSQI